MARSTQISNLIEEIMTKVSNIRSNIETPSEKILNKNIFQAEVIDSLERKIILKEPDPLEEYDLMKVMGEDVENKMCLMIASTMLYIKSIDGEPFLQPQSYLQFRHALQKVGKSSSAILRKLTEIGKVATESNLEEAEESAKSELKK
jgi:hypothetical protein